MFVVPSLWPTRVNESHVFDGKEQSQSRNKAMKAFLQEFLLNSRKDKLLEKELFSSPLSVLFCFLIFLDLRANTKIHLILAIGIGKSESWSPLIRAVPPCLGVFLFGILLHGDN